MHSKHDNMKSHLLRKKLACPRPSKTLVLQKPSAVLPSLRGGAMASVVDGDSDLSFEALTFGEDSGHIKKENKAGKKKSFKKDRLSAPQVCTF
jgi:hypothetical protein